jgi:hypothetical protein
MRVITYFQREIRWMLSLIGQLKIDILKIEIPKREIRDNHALDKEIAGQPGFS